jgi:hypothetical protein
MNLEPESQSPSEPVLHRLSDRAEPLNAARLAATIQCCCHRVLMAM